MTSWVDLSHAMRSIFLCALVLLQAGSTYSSFAQIITTYAGPTLPVSGQPALTQAIDGPQSVAIDNAGGFFAVTSAQNRVYHVDANGILTVIAGTGSPGYSGDGGPAVAAQLSLPTSIAVDGSGNLFIADTQNFVVRKVTGGIITTVAGTGAFGKTTDSGPATSVFLTPRGVAIDNAGNLIIADPGNARIRKVGSDGFMTTIAGNGTAGFAGDGGPAVAAELNSPTGIALDNSGDIFIADTLNTRIRKITPDGLITTIAGTGVAGNNGDGGPALSAELFQPHAVAVDSTGNVFIADFTIRQVTPGGIISTVAGTEPIIYSTVGGATLTAPILPEGVTAGAGGSLFITDTGNNRVWKLVSGSLSPVAGNGTAGYGGDGGPATHALLNYPDGLAVDAAGNLFISDQRNYRVRKVTPAGNITTIAGNGIGVRLGGDGGPATAAQLPGAYGIAVDSSDDVFIGDAPSIREVTPDGIINTIAGIDSTGFNGDGGPALGTEFNNPWSLVFDAAGNLFVADIGNQRVRRISPAGIVTTVAGTGTAGFSGDGGPATAAQLSDPRSLAIDSAGNLFIADSINNRIRKVTPDGIISTVAGNGTLGSYGDGVPATSAELANPTAVAFDLSGNLLVAAGEQIRKISNGTITTIVGNGGFGFSGDGGPAIKAQLNSPLAIAVDKFGNMYIADAGNSRIRKVSAAPSSALPRVGSFGQVASGGGWSTSLTLTNLSPSEVTAHVSFYSNDGSPLTLPLSFSNSSLPPVPSSSSDVTLSAYQSFSIETASSASTIDVGWADVSASGPLEGYAVFGEGREGVASSRGTVPLDNRFSSFLALPYDNTNGLSTGIALANPSASVAAITVSAVDQSGTTLASSPISLPPFGHMSFFGSDLFPATSNQTGAIQFQSSAGNVTGIGLLFYPDGSFTSLPVIQ